MVTNISPVYQKIVDEAASQNVILDNSRESLEWLRKKYASLKPSTFTEAKFLKDQDRRRRNPLVGRLYMFLYNPKTKEQLPYYDRFPLVFPYKKVPGGFYGLNLHYLPPKFRALLMDSLFQTLSNTRLDESTKLRISYKILDSSSKYRWFKPCVKHYLTNHLQSTLIYVDPSEWNLALFVPSEQFRKDSKANVWQDSIKAVN